MKNVYSLKVQSIKSKGQKQRPYVCLPVELAEAVSLKSGEIVEWELIDRGQLKLLRLEKKKKATEGTPAYPLRVQTIRSKGQKQRLYINIPVPLAAAIRLKPGEQIQWALNRKRLYLERKT